MEKEIIWTDHAKADLQHIYEFNIPIKGEEKAFRVVQRIAAKIDLLYRPVIGGTSYTSDLHPEMNYQKLIEDDYLIIYREEGRRIYINRIFDSRQNPEKAGL